MRRLKRAAHLLDATGIGKLALRGNGSSGVLVLNYHRIGDSRRSDLDRNLFSATPDAFDAQVAFVARHCEVITPDDLAEARRARGRYAMFTFDDGYRDNFDNALPILSSNGVAASFFPATGFVDQPRLAWWDQIAWMVRHSRHRQLPPRDWLDAPLAFDEPEREKAVSVLVARYKSLPAGRAAGFLDFLAEETGSGRPAASDAADVWMNWDMIRELISAGMSIGGHTVSHPTLPMLGRDEQRAEIAGCAGRLSAELGTRMSAFSYPRGAFNGATRTCLREVGVEYAFAASGGYSRFNASWDAYEIPRIGGDMTLEHFRSTVTLPRVFARR
jgi:peptidoglycan/xylan/chitin deacetylase (PgdA/CDA1 family)